MNNYYIYAYWRLDTNTIFYIGKGKDDRWKKLNRPYNQHFTRIINKIPIAVEILKGNLTEEEAFYWEEEIIQILVVEYGYSINIPKNRGKEIPPHLVNMTWGGEGSSGFSPSENTRKKMGEGRKGENNPMYGKKGELAPMYGVHRKGELAPMYGKHHTEKSKEKISNSLKGKSFTEEHKENLSKNHSNVKGRNNPSATSVICLTTKKIFFTQKDGGEFYNIKYSYQIGRCCRGICKSAGKDKNGNKLVWKYLIWNHNKIYRVKKC